MRLHDHLMTETPRPLMEDEPFTMYASLYGNATVVDITQVSTMLMGMTKFDEKIQEDLEDFGGDAYAWQMAQFFGFDWDTIDNVAPPFDTMCLEFDTYEATRQYTLEQGEEWDADKRRKYVHLGKTCVAMYYCPIDMFLTSASGRPFVASAPDVQNMLAQKNIGWVITATVFHYVAGKGMVGPQATWFIPVSTEGKIYTVPMGEREDRPRRGSDGDRSLLAVLRNPDDGWADVDEALTGRVAPGKRLGVCTGWQALVPSLLAINFMHTPGGERGYHQRVPGEATIKEQKAFMRRTFTPMTKWYTLDITALREALRASNGGKNPDSLAGLKKALHMVRGNYAHYAPNTYFGRKHDEWITVFRPGHRRGDLSAGKIDKDYRIS